MTQRSSSNRTSQGTRRRKAKRTIIPIRLLTAIIIVLVLLLSALIFLTRKPAEKVAAEIDDGTFYEGITVNGIDLSGKTLSEGEELVSVSAQEKISNVNLTISYQGKTWAIKASDINASTNLQDVLHQAMAVGRDGSAVQNIAARNKLKAEGQNFDTGVAVDEQALNAQIERIALEVDKEPTEPAASFDPNAEEHLTYTEGNDGLKVNVYATVAECLKAISSGSTAPISLVVDTQPCTTTIEEVRSKTKLVASFSTSFGSPASLAKEGRVKNLEKGASLISGLTLKPGESFSFNDHVGLRTEANGWNLATSIVNGNSFEESYGGGICQVSTTLYNALLRAGLDFTAMERKHHSFPSSYVPIGMDATVADSGPNFVFTNTRESTIYIFMTVDKKEKTITCVVYGPELPDGIKIDLRSTVTQTIDPPEAEIVEDETQPVGFERTLIESRKGQIAEVYLDKLDKDGKVIGSELLYTDTYKAVRGVKSVGIGTGSVEIPEE